jgi:hypothetical protein
VQLEIESVKIEPLGNPANPMPVLKHRLTKAAPRQQPGAVVEGTADMTEADM